MENQTSQEEVQHLRQEIQEIDAELSRLRAERRLFGRSSFSPEWLILRQRSLNTERDRSQSRLRELARTGHVSRHLRIPGKTPLALRVTVYSLSGIVVVLVVMAAFVVMGQERAAVVPVVGFAPTPSSTASATPLPTATPTPGPTIYKVAPGDTLYQIAKNYGVTIEAIVQANKLSDPRLINVGQELAIPATPTPAPRSTPTAKP
ncbi:MAG: LysM peptidoglycan-binding domain-containing protein [Dehalococcoidia bacterium]|nr:LysM peptidoglycan-binding domain-containing protein [Dehalococcoidia bacterium]